MNDPIQEAMIVSGDRRIEGLLEHAVVKRVFEELANCLHG